MLSIRQFRGPARAGIAHQNSRKPLQILLGRAAEVAFPGIDIESERPLFRLRTAAWTSLLLTARQIKQVKSWTPRLVEGEGQAAPGLRDNLHLEVDRIGVFAAASRIIFAGFRLEEAVYTAIVTSTVELDLKRRANGEIRILRHTR